MGKIVTAKEIEKGILGAIGKILLYLFCGFIVVVLWIDAKDWGRFGRLIYIGIVILIIILYKYEKNGKKKNK